MKTTLMMLSLAAVFAAGTACFGLFSGGDKPAAACAGLEGQERVDCEKRQAP